MNMDQKDFLTFWWEAHNQEVVFFCYHLEEKKILFFNSPEYSAFKVSFLKEILSNLLSAQNYLEEDDFVRFKLFVQSMRQGSSNQTVIRMVSQEGETKWLKLTGKRKHQNSDLYLGIIFDETSLYEEIQHQEVRRLLCQEQTSNSDDSEGAVLWEKASRDIVGVATSIPLILGRLSQLASDHYTAEGLIFIHISNDQEELRIFGPESMWPVQPERLSYQFPSSHIQKMMDEDLPYLILEDLSQCQDPSDWAIFIPQGIRSYVALPVKLRKKPRGILYLTSKRKGFFSSVNMGKYQKFQNLFIKALKKIPASKRYGKFKA